MPSAWRLRPALADVPRTRRPSTITLSRATPTLRRCSSTLKRTPPRLRNCHWPTRGLLSGSVAVPSRPSSGQLGSLIRPQEIRGSPACPTAWSNVLLNLPPRSLVLASWSSSPANPPGLDAALRTLRRDDAKAVMFSSDPTLGRLTSRLVEAAAKHRLPATGPRPDDSSVSARQSGQGHLVKPAAMSDPPSR